MTYKTSQSELCLFLIENKCLKVLSDEFEWPVWYKFALHNSLIILIPANQFA